MLTSSPQLYCGHEELKRTVEEDFPEVIADLEALLKTNVLSFTVEAGCFWRLFCTLPPLPFLHFSTCPTFAARINIPRAPEAISSWLEGEDWNYGEKTFTSSLQQSGPFFLLLFLCGLGTVGYLFLTSWVTIFRRFLHLAFGVKM